tara:strand:- start:2865 stop:3065 length:201 start_codon:yes stop_codon:yes gene_type:complete
MIHNYNTMDDPYSSSDEVFIKKKIDKVGDIVEEKVEGCLTRIWKRFKKRFSRTSKAGLVKDRQKDV